MAFETPKQKKALAVAKNSPDKLRPENKGLLSMVSSTPASNTLSTQDQGFAKSSSLKKNLPFRKKGLNKLSSSTGDQGDKMPSPYNSGGD